MTTGEYIERAKALSEARRIVEQDGLGPCGPAIESPYMDQRRMIQERVEAGQRAIEKLLFWRIVALGGWLAFGVVVLMR